MVTVKRRAVTMRCCKHEVVQSIFNLTLPVG